MDGGEICPSANKYTPPRDYLNCHDDNRGFNQNDNDDNNAGLLLKTFYHSTPIWTASYLAVTVIARRYERGNPSFL